MSDYRGLLAEMSADKVKRLKMSTEQANGNPGIPVNDSKFPAVIVVDDKTVKIVEYHEIPIGISFRVLQTGPLTLQNVLNAVVKWYEN